MYQQLIKYINHGILNKKSIVLFLFPQFLFKINARLLITNKSNSSNNIRSSSVIINSFSSCRNILLLKDYLKTVSQYFRTIVIHGSLATNETIPYSDFDALVIIKDEAFKDKNVFAKVAYRLHQSIKIMNQFDPLQHHGWFVLRESDLQNYPQTYFPYELFEYSVCLSDKPVELEISFDNSKIDYINPFLQLAKSILQKLDKQKIDNLYKLKGLLSQFMLLPSLYIQAKEKRGVYKKFSFDLAKRDFMEKDWAIMDNISQIRLQWNNKPNKMLLMVNRLTPLIANRLKKYVAPKIPSKLKIEFENSLFSEMENLIKKMQSKVNEF